MERLTLHIPKDGRHGSTRLKFPLQKLAKAAPRLLPRLVGPPPVMLTFALLPYVRHQNHLARRIVRRRLVRMANVPQYMRVPARKV